MLKKLLALATFSALLTPIAVLADTNQSSVPPQAVRATGVDSNVHLDLSAGFTSEHGNTNQVDDVYNYGATLYKNVLPKLKVYFYGGDQFEDEKANPGVVQPNYGAFVYNTGLTYKVTPVASVTASYDQTLGHNYRVSGPTVYHQLNLETNVHVF
jgi:hypothetical protein